MTQKEELKIFRDLMHKITGALIASEYKGDRESLSKILTTIRFSYCYPQTNSYEGQTDKDIKRATNLALNQLNDL